MVTRPGANVARESQEYAARNPISRWRWSAQAIWRGGLVPSLSKLPNVSLHAVCSASGARGNTYARRFGAAYFCSDYRQILDDPQTDVVMVLSRNQHHFSQAYEALMAGKHVFVEKPMALTEAECRELYNAVSITGNQLTSNT